MPNIQHIEPATDADWQRLYAACDHATFFHSPAWAAIWQQYTHGHWRPAPLCVRFDDGREAVIVRSLRDTGEAGEPCLSLSAPAGTFGGWIAGAPLTLDHGRRLQDAMFQLQPIVWRVNPYDPVAAMLDHGRGESQETMVIDLRAGMAAVERRWRDGSMARAVRKARRAGITVRPAARASDWDAYFDLYEMSLERWGARATSRYERPLFDALAREPRGVRLWLAVQGDRPVAGAIVLTARRHSVYWHGAADASAFADRPVNLLLHDAIRAAAGEGCWWFDLNPSGGHAGVARFKRSCGAQPLASPLVTIETGAPEGVAA